ncbi:glycosyltransferase [Candidatus Sumerlaeota bacterium]|nr:glycosyltransferase [Candidatus Sumerlaeota bacterium]
MAEKPFISIVVPALNAAGQIGRCLESLHALGWPESRREIIVVDNASQDGTGEIAANLGATVIQERHPGVAAARNAGWRAARGELIAFTDSDCIASPQWLRLLAPAFDDPRVAGAGGRLTPDTPKTTVEEYIIAKDILSQERALRDELLSPPFLVTANAMYRRSVLEEMGGFDEWFAVAGEDADLAWRVQWAGHTLAHIPEAEVVHCHRATLRGLRRQTWSYGVGTTHLFKKHRERLGFRRMTLRGPYGEVLRGLVLTLPMLVLGRTRLARLTPLYDVLSGISHIRGKIGASIRLRVWNI